jgi:hypothetical protein
VATKTGDDRLNAAVLGTIPNQSYKVKILNRGQKGFIMIGMAPTVLPDSLNFNQRGWYLYCYNGGLWSKNDNGCLYASAVNNGSVIEVVFDESTRTLSFVVDGIHKGVAFSNLPIQDIYPALEILDENSSVEIID